MYIPGHSTFQISKCSTSARSNCRGVEGLNPLSSLERPPSSGKFQPYRGGGGGGRRNPLAHWR